MKIYCYLKETCEQYTEVMFTLLAKGELLTISTRNLF